MANPFLVTAGSGMTLPDSASSHRYHSHWTKKVFNRDRRMSSWFRRVGSLQWVQAGADKIEYDEMTYIPVTDTVNGAFVAGDTVITVDNPGYFTTTGMVRVRRTGEIIRVLSISGSNLTVTRQLTFAAGGTAAAALVDGDVLLIIGNARSQISSAIECVTKAPSIDFNYPQFSSKTITMSKSARRVKARHGGSLDVWEDQMKEIEAWHERQMMGAWFYGERSRTDETSGETINTLLTFGGARYYLLSSPTSANNGGGALVKNDIYAFLSNLQSNSHATSVDMVMRPEIADELIKVWEGLVVYNDQLPKQIARNITSIKWKNCVYNIHEEHILKQYDDHSIYFFDTTEAQTDGGLLKVFHRPTGGGDKDTDGKPTWIFDQRSDGSISADTAQFLANWCPVFIGAGTGVHAIWSGIAHN